MTGTEAENAIKRRWLAAWDAAVEAVAARLEVEVGSRDPFETPAVCKVILDNEVEVPPDPPHTWVELEILDGDTFTETIGQDADHTSFATIAVRIHYPSAGAGGAPVGTYALGLLADAAAAILADAQFDEGLDENGVITRAARRSREAQSEDGAWWILAVLVPFEYTWRG